MNISTLYNLKSNQFYIRNYLMSKKLDQFDYNQ